VTSWWSHDLVESQELSSHFESLVCKLASVSGQMKFYIFSMIFYAMRWRPAWVARWPVFHRLCRYFIANL